MDITKSVAYIVRQLEVEWKRLDTLLDCGPPLKHRLDSIIRDNGFTEHGSGSQYWNVLDTAKRTIDIAVAWMSVDSARRLADFVESKALNLRILLQDDFDSANLTNPQCLEFLANANEHIMVKVYERLHTKLVLVDCFPVDIGPVHLPIMCLGSANLTFSGTSGYNEERVLVMTDPDEISREYMYFEKLWDKAKTPWSGMKPKPEEVKTIKNLYAELHSQLINQLKGSNGERTDDQPQK